MISLIPHAYAATEAQIAAQCFVNKINDAILFPLITLMMALAFLFFLFGAFEYVKNASNDSARETGRQHLFYGVIGMLVMLSAMSILSIAAGTFGFGVPDTQCDQMTGTFNAGISTNVGDNFGAYNSNPDISPTFGAIKAPGDTSSNGFGDSAISGVNLPSLPNPNAGSPDISIEPDSLLNPNPTDGSPTVDTTSANPRYPVVETWPDGSRVLSCGGDTDCTGAIQSCDRDHSGVYTGVGTSQTIVCKP